MDTAQEAQACGMGRARLARNVKGESFLAVSHVVLLMQSE
jgi:hypothetical protein